VNFDLLLGNSTANTNLNWSISSGEVLNILLVNSNVYPSLWNNFQTYLTTVEDIAVKTVTSTSAVISELSWADIVIFPPVTNSSASSDYTAIQTDMSDWINDGGKMLIMGSTNVGNILAMNFITGYYYGNYTGYTHYVNSSYYNHPYVQGVSTSFVPQSAALDAYIYNTGYVYLVYNTYYRQALSYFPLGDGEVIYYGFNFNTVYADMTKILDNIFESTLSDKATGVNWLSFNPTTGTASGGDTTTVSGTAYSDTLPAGVYNLNINVTTNDPTNPSFSIPVTFTVNGQGEGMMDNSCVNFGSVYQNMTHNEDVQVYNVGCDTLFISSASTGGSAFTTSSISLAIAPGDTGMVPVSLYQTSLGTVNDTLYVYSSVDTVQRCLTANVVGASDISVAPASIEVTINKCNGFATVPYTITNNGQAQLSYAVDVAEIYDSSYTQTWLYPAPNYSNTLVYNFNNIIDSDTIFYEIILNGEYSQTNNYFYLYANGSYMQTVYDNNVSNYTNDTISGFITGWQLTNIMNAGYLTVQLYSYNYNSVSGQTCKVHVWQRDDVTWASPVGAATGTLAAGNSVSKSILVTVSNLALGTYYTSVVFETNDPQDPVYQVPMTVHVVSEPDMVLGANAINYGNVYNTTPVIDSVLVENDGCTDLTISNVNSNNTHFVPSWTSKVIAAGASAWLDVTFTATTATQQTGILTITNNDSIQYVNLAANVIFAPDADYQYQVQNACNGEVSFINESTNGSQYFWAFGDGTFSAAVNPTHNYSKPGTYQVMLVTSNAGGSDTLYKNVALNDILYVASEFPDTVQAGTTVQFIDSSMYANSWQWYFGDGGNATSPNPQHTYANKGTFIVTLLVTNSAGCSGSDNDAIIVTSGIGIDEQAFEAVLYPNPTSALLHIDCTAAERIILYSNTGAQILDIPFVEDVDLSNIPAGTYQVVLRGSNGVWRETISVVR
jgi:PKD repeat protein